MTRHTAGDYVKHTFHRPNAVAIIANTHFSERAVPVKGEGGRRAIPNSYYTPPAAIVYLFGKFYTTVYVAGHKGPKQKKPQGAHRGLVPGERSLPRQKQNQETQDA
jgi:hypothetical protein